MKTLTTYLLVMLLACPAFAFQAVSTSRSNFGAAAQDGNNKDGKSAAPATRTFSTYASQQHNWSKGVETKPVQTQAVQTQSATAQVSTGTQVTQTDAQFTPNVQLPAANAAAQQPAAGTKQGANDKEKDKKGITAKSFQTAATPKQAQDAEPQTAQQATQMNQQDAAKMMQSLQGMMSGMPGGAAGGQAGGMPDISALMNSFGGGNPQGQQPKK